jgi:hypothetical protein
LLYRLVKMKDAELMEKILRIKKNNKYTLYDLSKILDIQVATIERWFKTKRINTFYAKVVKERLHIDEY